MNQIDKFCEQIANLPDVAGTGLGRSQRIIIYVEDSTLPRVRLRQLITSIHKICGTYPFLIQAIGKVVTE